jgi:hypothetical protein
MERLVNLKQSFSGRHLLTANGHLETFIKSKNHMTECPVPGRNRAVAKLIKMAAPKTPIRYGVSRS